MSKSKIDFDEVERQRDRRLRRCLLEALQFVRGNSPRGGVSGERLSEYAESSLQEDQRFTDDRHALRLIRDLVNRGYAEWENDMLRRGEQFALRHVKLVKITAKGSDLCDEVLPPDALIDDDRIGEANS